MTYTIQLLKEEIEKESAKLQSYLSAKERAKQPHFNNAKIKESQDRIADYDRTVNILKLNVVV